MALPVVAEVVVSLDGLRLGREKPSKPIDPSMSKNCSIFTTHNLSILRLRSSPKE